MKQDTLVYELYKANRNIRRGRPYDSESFSCASYRTGDLLEISIPCRRCPHDAQGTCIMCNYGRAVPIKSLAEVKKQVDSILNNQEDAVKKLLLGTNGSMLDSRCVTEPVLDMLLETVESMDVELVIIETHLETINREKLKHLRSKLSKPVLLEIGLETIDPFVQKECYLKSVSLETMERAFSEGHNLGFEFQVNIMLGAPFLTHNEQIDDAEKSLRWVLERADYAALFPMNIKPFTLLMEAYNQKLYSRISHWMVPILLDRFGADELGRIDLVWYGNRDIMYSNDEVRTIFPYACSCCDEGFKLFYDSFNNATTGTERKRIISDQLASANEQCECYPNLVTNGENYAETREERVHKAHRKLVEILRLKRLL